ncbi:TniQ family protein [Bacillus suaedaesalsae]|uniref:TniQ family protein n=1 Tax=Bacillus suaedaesalsae TaxID=2810349 RepID=A0ABS2DIE4_9BACI|nr:TniQ family protein [Bacillus suaedaesalsae]MBM6617293.1 TniQ family protein [Bacillus suaedaesalsae]
MEKFLIRTRPKEYEGLISYLHRLAKGNYRESFTSLLEGSSSVITHYNCNYLKEAKWESQAKKLVEMSENNIEELVLNKFNGLFFPTNAPTTFEYLKIYNHKFVRFCPQCLMEDYFYRIFWDVSFLTTCNKHKVFLIEKCPNCRERINMFQLLRKSCKCGMIIADMGSVKVPPSDNVIDSQNIVQELLLGNKNEFEIGNKEKKTMINQQDFFQLFILFANVIDKLPTDHELFNVVEDKPNKLLFNLHSKSKDSRNVLMLTTIVLVALNLVRNPEIYLPLLINHLDNLKSQKLIDRKAYERKMKILKDVFNMSYGKVYHKVFTRYIHSLGLEPENKRIILRPLHVEKEFISFHAASQLLNKLDYNTVRNLCKYGLLKSVEKENSTLIEKKSIVRYMKMRKSSINMNQVCSVLGLNLYVISELTKEGLLKANHGPEVDGYPKWFFKKENIEKFHDKIVMRCETIEIDDEWLPLNKVIYKIRLFDLSITDIFKSILKQHLRVGLKKGIESLEGLNVSKSDFHKLLVDSKLLRINKLGFTFKEASRVLKIGESTLEKYINQGVLKLKHTDLNPTQNLSKCIDKKQIIKFLKRKYDWNHNEVNLYINNYVESLVKKDE